QGVVLVGVEPAGLAVDGVGQRQDIPGPVIRVGQHHVGRVGRAGVVRGLDAVPLIDGERCGTGGVGRRGQVAGQVVAVVEHLAGPHPGLCYQAAQVVVGVGARPAVAVGLGGQLVGPVIGVVGVVGQGIGQADQPAPEVVGEVGAVPHRIDDHNDVVGGI